MLGDVLFMDLEVLCAYIVFTLSGCNIITIRNVKSSDLIPYYYLQSHAKNSIPQEEKDTNYKVYYTLAAY